MRTRIRLLVGEEERSREKRKLGSNSAIFPGKGEPNFNSINVKSSVLD